MENNEIIIKDNKDNKDIASDIMLEEIKNLKITKYESEIISNALYEFRNKKLNDNKDVDYIDKLILKIIDTPLKKPFRKAVER